ncbi:MAG: hypothetical protein ACKN9T_01745 [Candidatus Methylumidiphilus sp.]
MKRLPETVANRFTELFAALRNAADDLKMAAAEANLLGDFSRVEALNDNCRRLLALDADIKASVNGFESRQDTRPAVPNKPHKNTRHRTRKAGGRLRVKLGDQAIEEATIAETFVKTLRSFGLERVAKLNKVLSSVPLVAKTPVINGYQSQKRCDGWYVTTHVNLQNARALLEEIGRALNVPVKVEYVER